jgi:hypothetical protein
VVLLCELLDEFVQAIGVQHVVQVRTYKVANDSYLVGKSKLSNGSQNEIYFKNLNLQKFQP